jgi:hypothetical protein
LIHPMRLPVDISGTPHLAKNERDVGHPALVVERLGFADAFFP